MFTVVLPPSIAPATQYAGQAPQLTPGQVVEATVLALLQNGAVRLALADLVLDVRSQVPLEVGSTLRLAVKGTAEEIKLVPIPGSVRPPVKAGDMDAVRAAFAPASAEASASRSAAPPESNWMPSPNAGRAPDANRPMAARAEPLVKIDVPRTEAFVAGVADAQAQVRSVATNGPSMLAAAVAISDALLNTSQKSRPPAEPQGASLPPASPEAALGLAVRAAAARQGGLAPLIANLDVVAPPPTALPIPLRQAIAQVLALRVPADQPVSAQVLKGVFARSGLFLEKRLAQGQPGQAPLPAHPAPDLKLALVTLRQVLREWVGDFAGAAPARADLAVLGRADLAAPGRAVAIAHAPPLTPADSAVKASTPPPPYRGAPTSAQPASALTLVENMPLREVAERLLAQTEGALARQTLMQAASLPERAEQGRQDSQGTRWAFEMPLLAPQGTSIAQFEISRDSGGEGHQAAKPVWRVRFSVDVEPLGAVHAQLSLIGERVTVMLWAEREDSTAQLREGTDLLAEALKSAELEPEISLRTGAPRPMAKTKECTGHFLDQAS